MKPTTLLLVRHAHAHWTPDDNRSLSAAGRAAAARLAGILVERTPKALYSSPSRRAVETLEPLAERLELPIRTLEDLRERSLGTEWVEDWPAEIRPTWQDFALPYPAGGETNLQAMARAESALQLVRQRHRGETVALATHGNLLTLMIRVVDPSVGFDFWSSLTMPDLFRLELFPDGSSRHRRLWQESEPS